MSMRVLLVLLTLMTTLHAYAYRNNHGLIPEAIDACAAHVNVTLSIPPNGQPDPNPFQGEFSHGFYHVEEIDSGLYYMTDGTYQAIFLVDDKGIIVVDAPPSIGINNQAPDQSVSIVDVIYSINATAGKDIKILIYSHSHLDHIGAAGTIKASFPDVKIIAHRETARTLHTHQGMTESFLSGTGPLPVPDVDISFRHHKKIKLGRQSLMLREHGPIHEPGNLFIYAKKQKVLMLVDVIFPGSSPFNDLALAEDVPAFINSHDIVLSYDFDVFIGGHLNRLGTREDVKLQKQYIMDIRANAKAALRNPELFAAFGLVPNALGAFGIYLDQVACDCANRTLNAAVTPSGKAWLNILGTADRNTVMHCGKIAESLRIDPQLSPDQNRGDKHDHDHDDDRDDHDDD